jgi:hypothetical protein
MLEVCYLSIQTAGLTDAGVPVAAPRAGWEATVCWTAQLVRCSTHTKTFCIVCHGFLRAIPHDILESSWALLSAVSLAHVSNLHRDHWEIRTCPTT